MNIIDGIVKSVKSKKQIKNINDFVKDVYYEVNENPNNTVEVPYMLVWDVVSRMITTSYKLKDIDCMNFRDWDKLLKIDEINNKDIVIPKDHKATYDHFMTLYNTPQPDQRTKEWFDYRYNRITASDTATAIDCNPYESVESFICKKCDPNFPFLDNDFVFHGKKYEQIATSLYEHIYNTKVTEFGCLPSDKHLFLGASPDGICSKSTLDYKFNPKIGTMLEIKCPFVREITNKGKIAGEICPYYYYCQVQQQLECCDLEVCDFIQCNLSEYKSREEYLLDTEHKFVITEDVDGRPVDIDNIMSKGYLIQLLPKVFTPRFDGDKHHYKGVYIYPPRLNMTKMQYDEWVVTKLDTWKTDMPEIAETHYFDKVLYWKISNAHTVAIPRDKEWFANIFPVLKETWAKVTYYRDNLQELPLVQEIADKRKAFWKFKGDFKVNNFDNTKPFMDTYTAPVKAKNAYKGPYKKYTAGAKSGTSTYTKTAYKKPEKECDFVDD